MIAYSEGVLEESREGKIFPKDRARDRVPGHLLWWKEK